VIDSNISEKYLPYKTVKAFIFSINAREELPLAFDKSLIRLLLQQTKDGKLYRYAKINRR
jgi:hypothetical protein